jgi:osmotically-inducible protein OsmY
MNSKTDDQLKHEVESALKWDTRTWNQKIGVDVTRGAVTLSGVVPTYSQRVAAGMVTHACLGATHVANELLVARTQPYADMHIARVVRGSNRTS